MFLGGLFEGKSCDEVYNDHTIWSKCKFLKDCGEFKKGDNVRRISFYQLQGVIYVQKTMDDTDGTRVELMYIGA